MGESHRTARRTAHGARHTRRNLANAVSESVRRLVVTRPDSPWAQDWTGAAWWPRGGEGDETGQMKTNLESAYYCVGRAASPGECTAQGLMELSRPSACSSVVGVAPLRESGKWGGVQQLETA